MRSIPVALLLLLTPTMMLLACGDEGMATPAPTPVRTASAPAPTFPPTAFPTPAPTRVSPTATPQWQTPTRLAPTPTKGFPPTATATPAPVAKLDFEIRTNTLWEDLMPSLYPHERSCIEAVEHVSLLGQRILTDATRTLLHEIEAFACLEPGTARAVYLSYTMAELGHYRHPALAFTEDETDCARRLIAEVDAAGIVAAAKHWDTDLRPYGEFLVGLFRCAPGWVVTAMGDPWLAKSRLELSGSETDCVQAVLTGLTVSAILSSEEGYKSQEFQEFMRSVNDCVPSLFHYRGPDGHAISIEDAMPIEVGHSTVGAIGYESLPDYFAFWAEQGVVYRIHVRAGDLEQVEFSLFSPYPEYQTLHRAHSSESADGQGVSVFWNAPFTGETSISVFGYPTGQYVLTVVEATVDDDHGNTRETATPLTYRHRVTTDLDIGKRDTVRGELEFIGDIDTFRVDTEAGTVYELAVHLGTLRDSRVGVEDNYGWNIAYNDDGDGLGSLVRWRSEETGPYFINVEGYDSGTYELSFFAWRDDHGDSSETATEIRVGEFVKSNIDVEGDVDFFVLNAEKGVSYLIETALGDLDDNRITLLDREGKIESDGRYNDDRPAEIRWKAPASGPYWIAVEGAGTGTYSIEIWSSGNGSCATDRTVLEALYKATDGGNWQRNENWLSESPVEHWEGVSVNGDGCVTALHLSYNSLYGRIPAELGDLEFLNHLDLVANRLHGPMPPELGRLQSLHQLELGQNGLSGPIPVGPGSFQNLKRLNLVANRLRGPIPPELGTLRNLVHLHLGQNALTGPIPRELGDLTNLNYLALDRNELAGEIPAELGNLTGLEQLYLDFNQLTGPIPPQLGNLVNLNYLKSSFNQLSGAIPPELGRLANLKYLDLGPNALTGPIPSELQNLTQLIELDLSGNSLEGEIPGWIGNFAGLENLYLYENRLTGAMPDTLGGLSSLKYLMLGENQLSGTIPGTLGNLTELEWLWLSVNGLSGPIPNQLGNLTELQYLFLDDNQLSGAIPDALGNLNNLDRLALSDNDFTGCLPATLLEVAVNDLSSLDLPLCK